MTQYAYKINESVMVKLIKPLMIPNKDIWHSISRVPVGLCLQAQQIANEFQTLIGSKNSGSIPRNACVTYET